ncbi:MAG: MATE family efflux transporter [Bacillota bacterium]|nr:MATE family efflux transporter [Bacillota bacterium]
MLDAKKTEIFESMPIPKAVAKLAVPTVISCLVMVLYNLADTYFVGFINSPVQTAAVTYAAPVLLAFNAVNNLFGTGCSSLMSRALGAKDYDTVRRTAAFGFYSAMICGLLFSLASVVLQPGLLSLLGVDARAELATRQYMLWTVTLGAAPAILNVVLSFMIRAEGSSAKASIGVISGCVLNVILDPVFIMPWGLDMGAAGAGCATFISNCVACLYYLVFLMKNRRSTFVDLSPKMFGFRKAIVLGAFAVGIPAAIQNLLNVTGMTVLNNLTAPFGTAAVAAMGITHKVNMVPMYISMGLGQGIMPLVGYNYSAGNGERMKKAIVFTLKLTVGFILTAAALYFIFAEDIIRLFMKNGDIVSYGGAFLRGFCLGLPFLAVDFLAVGIFQAVGMGKESLVFAVLRKVALEIPALLLLNRIWPLYGMAYSQLVAEFVLCAAAIFVLWRLFKRVENKK